MRRRSNSLDAVGSRDFALAALANLSIAATHLSRLAEEIVLWTSPQFGFATLSDAWSTGSSIMPQKRNPDAAELIRAKAARVGANFAALNAIVQKLPLAYAKDLQEDKALTFEAFDAFALCITAMIGMIDTITLQPRRHARSGRARLFHRHRSRRLAGARAESSRSAKRTRSPAASCAAPRIRAWQNLAQLPLARIPGRRAAHHRGRAGAVDG